MIKRDYYLKKLINKRNNGFVKVITGLRRCGKTFLLFDIFAKFLEENGVEVDHIITLSLDDFDNQRYWNPNELNSYIRKKIIPDGKTNYVFIDEIQFVKDIDNQYLEGSKVGFVDVVLGLMKLANVDLYITGSNSEMLSKNILTKFRGRGDQIYVAPLSFKELYDAFDGEKNKAWKEYLTFGGMPQVALIKDDTEKGNYLKNLFTEIYIKDIMESHNIKNNSDILGDLLNVISSSIGSLTNPLKLSNTFKSVKKQAISPATIDKYLECFADSFLVEKAKRYDIKGRKYIGSPQKYYFTDIGLRNARLNFAEIEETHLMENILYNELRLRGFNVDVGVVDNNYKDENGKSKRSQFEIDFVCNKGNEKVYIQSAFSVASKEKYEQEIRGFLKVNDSFKKIVVLKDDIVPRMDENGILFVSIEDFLLDDKYTSV